MMPKLLIISEKDTLDPCICTMKQNHFIFLNQLFHGWHEVVEKVNVVT